MTEKRVFHVVKNIGNNKLVLFGIFSNKTILMNSISKSNNYFLDLTGKRKVLNMSNLNKYFSNSKKTLKIYNKDTNELTFSVCPITINNINPTFKSN